MAKPEIYTADQARAFVEAATPGTLESMFGWTGPQLIWTSDVTSVPRTADLPPWFPTQEAQGAARWRGLAASVEYYAARSDRAEAERDSYRARCAQLENERHAMPDLRVARQAADIARRRAELAEDDLQQVRKERDRLRAAADVIAARYGAGSLGTSPIAQAERAIADIEALVAERDRLVRILAVEGGDASQALEGWRRQLPGGAWAGPGECVVHRVEAGCWAWVSCDARAVYGRGTAQTAYEAMEATAAALPSEVSRG